MIKPIPTRRYPRASTVGILFVLACVVAMLAGCAESPGAMTLTDENGCKWSASIYKHENGDRYGEIQRLTDTNGKQICK